MMLDLLLLMLLAAAFAAALRYVHACDTLTAAQGSEHIR
jgi:hypothetical protein